MRHNNVHILYIICVPRSVDCIALVSCMTIVLSDVTNIEINNLAFIFVKFPALLPLIFPFLERLLRVWLSQTSSLGSLASQK